MFKLSSCNCDAHQKYRPDIDGLRALAIIFVVAFHAFPNKFPGGFVGVDIFFVISGYLITGIILKNSALGLFSIQEFYERRARRIFPALSLVILILIAFGWFMFFADEYAQLGKYVAAGTAFVANLALWADSGYFDNAADSKPLLHLWSLGIEEQFYIFWPMIVVVAMKYRINILLLSVSIGVISFFANTSGLDSNSVGTFYSPVTRSWELLIGSCIAAYKVTYAEKYLEYPKLNHRRKKVVFNLLAMIGIFLIVLGVCLINKKSAFPGFLALLPTVGAALIIVSGKCSWFNKKILSSKILVWIGLISYPLYLWHWPLLSVAKILGFESKYTKIAIVAASLVLSWATYRYVERTFRNDTHKNRLYFITTVMGILFLAGLLIYKMNGVPSRFDDGKNGLLIEKYKNDIKWPDSYNHSDGCTEKFGADQYCLVSDINREPTVAIIGDSHANHFFHGLSEHVKSTGGNLLLAGAGACLPFFGIDRGPHPSAGDLNCHARMKAPFEFVKSSKFIKTVYIAFAHNEPFRSDIKFIDRWGQLNSNDYYRNAVDAFLRTVKVLEANGKEVILIYDLPYLSDDPGRCFNKRPFELSPNDCKIGSLEMIYDFHFYDAMIKEVSEKSKLKVFNTHQYLEGNFPISSTGDLNYRDASHLSMSGSLFFAEKY